MESSSKGLRLCLTPEVSMAVWEALTRGLTWRLSQVVSRDVICAVEGGRNGGRGMFDLGGGGGARRGDGGGRGWIYGIIYHPLDGD